jgi:hypothetical protein
MIQKHLPGICNYFENHTTNGLIERMNTKIKLIKRMSYGWLFGLCYAMDGGYKGCNPYIERHLAIFVNYF